MNILFMAHSGLRWLILIVALIAVIKFLVGWLRGGSFKGMDRGLMAGFSGGVGTSTFVSGIFSGTFWTGAGAGETSCGRGASTSQTLAARLL